MKAIRKIEISPGTVIDKAIQRAIEQADDDILEFDFNGVTVQVESDSDAHAKHQEWHATMDANCKRLIAEKNRQEHPEQYWTTDKPSTPGWYFAKPGDDMRRKHGLLDIEVVRVERHWDDGPLQFRYGRFDWFAEGLRAVHADFSFAGPIPEPK